MSTVNWVAYSVLSLLFIPFFIALYRVVAGPTMPDRMLALDFMGAVVIGIIIVYSIVSAQAIFLDVAVLLAMLSFFASVSFAYYLGKKGRP